MNFLFLLPLLPLFHTGPCMDFDRLDKQIRDGTIEQSTAAQVFSQLIPQLNDYAAQICQSREENGSRWVFPVDGARLIDIGGRSGNGYRPQGYDYYAGNRHHGHPAQDIFIHDKNQDEQDDRTGKPVVVRSVVNGIVIALESEWESNSSLRGGRYVMVYQSSSGDVFCYSHLRKVTVQVGECVAAGQVIGEVGRSGKTASPKRSPTHLHLTRLRVVDGRPHPIDSYPELRQAIGRSK